MGSGTASSTGVGGACSCMNAGGGAGGGGATGCSYSCSCLRRRKATYISVSNEENTTSSGAICPGHTVPRYSAGALLLDDDTSQLLDRRQALGDLGHPVVPE